MKKLITLIALTLLISSLGAVAKKKAAPAPTAADVQRVAADDDSTRVTPAQEAACQRVVEALRERYISLEVDGVPLHLLIEEALQEIADENRADFDVAKKILGVKLDEAQGDLPAGIWVLPVPVHFVLK